MKKYITRILALLLLASAVTSCSVEYRQRHGHHDDHHDHDDHHEYRQY
jgi:hypothetical protein